LSVPYMVIPVTALSLVAGSILGGSAKGGILYFSYKQDITGGI
jgi:hypothetical protein